MYPYSISTYLQIYRYTYLPIYLPTNPSIHQSINPSIHQSIHPSIHPSIYLIYTWTKCDFIWCGLWVAIPERWVTYAMLLCYTVDQASRRGCVEMVLCDAVHVYRCTCVYIYMYGHIIILYIYTWWSIFRPERTWPFVTLVSEVLIHWFQACYNISSGWRFQPLWKIRPHRRCWGVIFRMALVKGYRFTWGGGSHFSAKTSCFW